MYTNDELFIQNESLFIEEDFIEISKIKKMKVRNIALCPWLLSILAFGLITTVLIWFIPFFNRLPELTLYLSVFYFLFGIGVGVITMKRFQLIIAVESPDRNELRWFAIAKSHQKGDLDLFRAIEQQFHLRLQR
jgi:hypothetical protein